MEKVHHTHVMFDYIRNCHFHILEEIFKFREEEELLEKTDNTYAAFNFTVDCRSHTLEEVLGFMRTEGLLRKWAFDKAEGEYYCCKVYLEKSKFTECGRLGLDQMVDLIYNFLPQAEGVEVDQYPGEWMYILDGYMRIDGPWTSWTKDPKDFNNGDRKAWKLLGQNIVYLYYEGKRYNVNFSEKLSISDKNDELTSSTEPLLRHEPARKPGKPMKVTISVKKKSPVLSTINRIALGISIPINATYDLIIVCRFNTSGDVLEFIRTEGSPEKWNGVYQFKINFGEKKFANYGSLRPDQVVSFANTFLSHAAKISIGYNPMKQGYMMSEKIEADETWTDWIKDWDPEYMDEESISGVRIDIKSAIIDIEGVLNLYRLMYQKGANIREGYNN